MVSSPQKSSNGSSSLTNHADSVSHQQLIAELQELVDSRQLDTDDNIYNITGTVNTISSAIEHINNVSSIVPQALQDVWEQERQLRNAEVSNGILQQQQAEFIERIAEQTDRLQLIGRKAVARSTGNLNWKLQGVSWGLGGVCVGLLVAWAGIFPRQLSLARGSDGAMLEWLGTPQGRLMRRSFAAGNRSVEECLRKGIKKTGKTVCLLEIK